MTAETVCNQVLQKVKGSNHNFIINETPYSAYVTIRKTFVKHSAEEKVVTHQNHGRENAPKADLEHKCETLIVENNNLREKQSKLETENKNLNIRLEIVKGQLSNKNDALENAVEEKKVFSKKN